jgi:hypothetical protein
MTAKMSALCRTVKKDGWDLDIVIYDDGEGSWALEVADGPGSATCWLESFATEQEALDEALKVIEENDLEYFHSPPPWLAH